jgi:beta-galactosidase
VARWDRDYLKNLPAVTERNFGRGTAVYYGSLFNLEAARHLMKRYTSKIGLTPLIAGLPDQIEVTRRTKGFTDFYFILNHGDASSDINISDGFVDILAGTNLPAHVTLPPFGYRILRRERASP